MHIWFPGGGGGAGGSPPGLTGTRVWPEGWPRFSRILSPSADPAPWAPWVPEKPPAGRGEEPLSQAGRAGEHLSRWQTHPRLWLHRRGEGQTQTTACGGPRALTHPGPSDSQSLLGMAGVWSLSASRCTTANALEGGGCQWRGSPTLPGAKSRERRLRDPRLETRRQHLTSPPNHSKRCTDPRTAPRGALGGLNPTPQPRAGAPHSRTGVQGPVPRAGVHISPHAPASARPPRIHGPGNPTEAWSMTSAETEPWGGPYDRTTAASRKSRMP